MASSQKQAMDTTSSAEQLAKEGEYLQQAKVAYVHCPKIPGNRTPHVVSTAIENAVQIGSTIINLIFDSEADKLIGGVRCLRLEDRLRIAGSAGAVLSLYSTDSWRER